MTTPDHAHPAEPAERASWLWRRLGIAYVLVIVLCIGLYLHGRWEGVLTALQEPAPGLMGCAILAAVLAYLLQARAFVTIQLAVEAPTRPVPVRNWLYLFFHGYMGRYIPGKAPLVLGRMLGLGAYGVSGRGVTVAALYENLLALMAAFLVSVPILLVALPGDVADTTGPLLAAGIALLVMVGLVMTPLMHSLLERLLKLLRRRPLAEGLFPGRPRMLLAIGIYLASMLCGGIAFYALAASFFPADGSPGQLLFFLASFYFASAAGILMIFVPSGIGVREGLIVYFLAMATDLMPPEAATMLAVSFRILLTLIEMILWSMSALLRRTEALTR